MEQPQPEPVSLPQQEISYKRPFPSDGQVVCDGSEIPIHPIELFRFTDCPHRSMLGKDKIGLLFSILRMCIRHMHFSVKFLYRGNSNA